MNAATITQQAPTAGALASQRLFESITGPAPSVDTRTPAQVRAQAEAEGWR
jgi:hypothetical protein